MLYQLYDKGLWCDFKHVANAPDYVSQPVRTGGFRNGISCLSLCAWSTRNPHLAPDLLSRLQAEVPVKSSYLSHTTSTEIKRHMTTVITHERILGALYLSYLNRRSTSLARASLVSRGMRIAVSALRITSRSTCRLYCICSRAARHICVIRINCPGDVSIDVCS